MLRLELWIRKGMIGKTDGQKNFIRNLVLKRAWKLIILDIISLERLVACHLLAWKTLFPKFLIFFPLHSNIRKPFNLSWKLSYIFKFL
jgi:hypothetical protein